MARELDTWMADAQAKIKNMPPDAKELRETALQDLWFYARLVNPGYVYGDVHKQ